MSAEQAPAPGPRRRVPLRATCAQPHECSPEVRFRVLRKVPFFADLDDVELTRVDQRTSSLSWGEGDPLYAAGEPASALYVLAAGRVALVQGTPDGGEVITDVLVPGDLFGSVGTLGDVEHTETARAMQTVCALRIDAGVFRGILVEFPAVTLRVLDVVAERLARTRGQAAARSGSVESRVAAALLRLDGQLGQERARGGSLLQLSLSRADLARLAGSTPESVSRVMSRLKREGIVDTGRRWTAILDHARLEALTTP